ncbi:MAG: hypothetical protein ACI4F2_03590 [Acutalibacteraceae bacterium]
MSLYHLPSMGVLTAETTPVTDNIIQLLPVSVKKKAEPMPCL